MKVRVHLELVRRGLADAAHRAHVVFDALVAHRVLLQLVLGHVAFGTVGTGEGLLAGVHKGVFLKRVAI